MAHTAGGGVKKDGVLEGQVTLCVKLDGSLTFLLFGIFF